MLSQRVDQSIQELAVLHVLVFCNKMIGAQSCSGGQCFMELKRERGIVEPRMLGQDVFGNGPELLADPVELFLRSNQVVLILSSLNPESRRLLSGCGGKSFRKIVGDDPFCVSE